MSSARNALILHGTGANPGANWFPWLRALLESKGYSVLVPLLPGADSPDMQRYKQFIDDLEFSFGSKTFVVGHSSGAVATLSYLSSLPVGQKIDLAVMVGVYRPENANYSTKEPIDVEKLKGKAERFIFIHSDNDPFCPLKDAQYFANELGAELIVIPGAEHFSSMGRESEGVHTELPVLQKLLGDQ